MIILVVDKDTLARGLYYYNANAGSDDAIDSDINETTGQSDTVTIYDSNITTVDGGICSQHIGIRVIL